MTSKELRQKFLNFFREKGHAVIPSASLVPENDPSVLFTTAGMQQFKPFYTKPEDAPSTRVTSIQLCVRTSDIEEVGDRTHLTSFEMLGNFSFGYPSMKNSYFKEDAIKFAWEFLTSVLEIETKRISCTYFKGEGDIPGDEESRRILKKVTDFLDEKIVGTGKDETFWGPTGEKGPCGPTVEFYVDGIEIWNLVFNQYFCEDGRYTPLNYQGIDTGMGLERLLTIMNPGLSSVYSTDLFDLAHKKLHELLIKEDVTAERIILDHIRAATFIINDGIVPSNKDRGYILRRLIRRAVVKAQQIGIADNFTAILAKEYIKTYNKAYNFHSGLIEAELDKEETKFRRTLKEGLKLLNSYKEIDGKILFDLYQSFGLPSEITLEEAKSRGIKINNSTIQQFNNYLREHQELSRTASAGMFKGGLADAGEIVIRYHTATHLLNAALRKVLGDHVYQKGSNITAERIRFDFSHPEKMTREQIKEVENLVNEQIKKDLPVNLEEMTLEDAQNSGAIGVFESKYGDKVKVYTVGQAADDYFSKEICGGPHITHTGELGCFKIVKEEASSAGVRRIKAILE